jgi:xanthine/uracil permease
MKAISILYGLAAAYSFAAVLLLQLVFLPRSQKRLTRMMAISFVVAILWPALSIVFLIAPISTSDHIGAIASGRRRWDEYFLGFWEED